MPTIKIDGKDYDSDTLSVAAKEQLQSLQFVNNELVRLQAQVAVFQTAQAAYGRALREALPTPLDQVMAQGDTMKFS